MGLLGEIYSFGNRTRNKLRGLLDDPKGYLQQTADQTANTLRDMTGANETAQQFALRDKINAGDKNALEQYRNLEKTIQNKLFDVALNFNPAAVGMTAKAAKEAPYAEAHRIAQRNAALPVEQGGLGLPANNTAMDRARAMDYVTAPSKEVYHATDVPWEGSVVDPSKSDFGFHVGTNEQANARIMSRGKDGVSYREGANVMPLMVNKYANLLKVTDEGTFHADSLAPQLVKKGMLSKEEAKVIDKEIGGIWDMDKIAAYDQQMRDLLAKHGYDGVKYKNVQEGDGMSYAFGNPSMVRSRFAAFDPMRRNEADILGYATVPNMLGAAALGAGGMYGLGLLGGDK